MTNEITRERAIEILNRPTCKWTIEEAKNEIERKKKVIEFWKQHSLCYEAKYRTKDAENMIALLQEIISVLMEREAEQEVIRTVRKYTGRQSSSSFIRKTVAVMANRLRRIGISLSEAFKKAWSFVKFCISHRYLIERMPPALF